MEKDDGQLLNKAIRENEPGWQSDQPGQEDDRGKSMTTKVTGKVNMAGICALSRRLMAIERARALGRKPVDAYALALELEARHWAGGSAERSSV